MFTHILLLLLFFFFNDTATTEIYPLSLHDALPICQRPEHRRPARARPRSPRPHRASRMSERSERIDKHCACRECGISPVGERSEEHTSELQSPCNIVCRLLLEKKQYI